MKIKEFIKSELSGWTAFEKVLLVVLPVTVAILSVIMKDAKIATISAVFGILSTIIAGKGKISCYFFGIVSVLTYSYLAMKNALYGSLALYVLYYFPMEFIGIHEWKNHLKETSKEIYKSSLSLNNRIIFSVLIILTSILLGIVLNHFNDKFSFIDAFVTVLSIVAMYLAVKRCIEQWICWTIVNFLNLTMWFMIFKSGSSTFAMFLMWFIYLCLGVSFFYKWSKELKKS